MRLHKGDYGGFPAASAPQPFIDSKYPPFYSVHCQRQCSHRLYIGTFDAAKMGHIGTSYIGVLRGLIFCLSQMLEAAT